MGPIGPALALACRIVLAGALAFAAGAKIADRRALPSRLREMGVVPPWFSVFLAVALPIVEVAVAAALVVARESALPGLVAAALLVAFTGFLVATRRREVPCACFGNVRPDRAAGAPEAVTRNGLLLALAVLATGSAHGARAEGTLIIGAFVVAVAVQSVLRVA